jgi:histidinol dehydrogenase
MSESIITRLDASQSDFNQRLDQLLAWESVSDTRVATVVDDILHQVKARGDAAVLEFTNKFDRRTAQSINDFFIAPAQLQHALTQISAAQRAFT